MSRSGRRVDAHFGDEEPLKVSAEVSRVYLLHYAAISDMRPGTPEAKAYLDQMARDPEFQAVADDILELQQSGSTPQWIKSFFRAAAKRALRAQEDDASSAYAENPSYGMF